MLSKSFTLSYNPSSMCNLNFLDNISRNRKRPAQRFTPVIPALRRLRQEDCEFKASPGIGRPCL
jgi:hypothetical protein